MFLPLPRFSSLREGPATALPCGIRAFARATVRALGRDFGLGDPRSPAAFSTRVRGRSAEPAPDPFSESHTRVRVRGPTSPPPSFFFAPLPEPALGPSFSSRYAATQNSGAFQLIVTSLADHASPLSRKHFCGEHTLSLADLLDW